MGMGGGGMMPMMMRMHQAMMGRMAGGPGGIGMGMSGMGGFAGAYMGGMGMSGMGALLPRIEADTNGDGMVTPEELRNRLGTLLGKYDADRNGALSLDEFARLHADLMRETMVDRFQFFDDDGDGSITASEIVKPAIRLERMQTMMPKAGMMGVPAQGTAVPGQQPPTMMPGQSGRTTMPEQSDDMMPGQQGMMTGNGRMMQGN